VAQAWGGAARLSRRQRPWLDPGPGRHQRQAVALIGQLLDSH